MIQAYAEDGTGRPILDLRSEAKAHRPNLAGLPTLTDDERLLAARTWRGRMVNEHMSAQVFAGLVPQLMRAAVPPAVQAEVPTMIADEYRHACQCAGVVLALGEAPIAVLPAVEPLPTHDDVGPLEAVLRNVISIGCMSETVAVALIRAEHAELEGSPLADVLGTILADEVQHARFGWRLLGLVASRLDVDARDRLSAWLEVAFEHQIRWELPKLPLLGLVGQQAGAAGVCDGLEARALFFDTFEAVIVPQLDAAGLAATPAWERAKAATASAPPQ